MEGCPGIYSPSTLAFNMHSLQTRAFDTQSHLFRRLGQLLSSKTAAVISVVFALSLGAVCIAGLSSVERETSVVELCRCCLVHCDNLLLNPT